VASTAFVYQDRPRWLASICQFRRTCAALSRELDLKTISLRVDPKLVAATFLGGGYGHHARGTS